MSKRSIFIFALFLGFSLFLTLNRHSRTGIQNYHSEIWADKAGYYVYLPATFIYDFKAENFPEKIDQHTGNGFSLDHGIIKTKYTYGVALLQSPFFLTAHFLAHQLGLETSGFSLIYHKAIDISAVVYSSFGLLFLYFFLVQYVPNRIALFTIAAMYFGTNLLYYSIFETGMSHVYSFFVFSAILYLAPQFFNQKKTISTYLIFGVLVGILIAVRPINVIFLPTLFLFISWKDLLKKPIPYLIIAGIASFVIILPQLFYWNYSSRSPFHYSYESEGFPNLLSPKLLELWFSTNNGLFTFNPLLLFLIPGTFLLYKTYPKQGVLLGAFALFISYVFSSWHDWTYGCSFGSRPFVEYYTLFSLPMAFFIKKIDQVSPKKTVLFILIVLLILYNIKLTFSYDGCWYGGIWDWSELQTILLGPLK